MKWDVGETELSYSVSPTRVPLLRAHHTRRVFAGNNTEPRVESTQAELQHGG